jgi:low temperature requirement protein LtrA
MSRPRPGLYEAGARGAHHRLADAASGRPHRAASLGLARPERGAPRVHALEQLVDLCFVVAIARSASVLLARIVLTVLVAVLLVLHERASH